MKNLFYVSLASLVLFEVANVYFIMPMPGSQDLPSLDTAYFLHTWRWAFRLGLGLLAGLGLARGRWANQWLPAGLVAVWAVVAYVFNFQVSADHMFYLPGQVLLKPAAANQIDSNRLVLGVALGGAARAYPIQLIGYHHQVLDTVAGRPVMVTYCTVCRTGRVFAPTVGGQTEAFRLVGMDHFNAMFEDRTTRSWWRQATGLAVAGPRKGASLPEIPSQQMALGQWLRLYPHSLVLQPDPAFQPEYDSLANYETTGKGSLTRTDTASWQPKSWVVGLKVAGAALAVDWNRLKRERVVNETVGPAPVVVALAADHQSFVAYQRPSPAIRFAWQGDQLVSSDSTAYSLAGTRLRGQAGPSQLVPVPAYQEFWHSWQTFNPHTGQY
jgi:hypothetical protein